jgi:hypothetical protein
MIPAGNDVLTKAMTSLAGGPKKKADEPNKKVVLKREDVNIIVRVISFWLTMQVNEFEISRTAAEKALRQNQGELIPTITQLINAC